MMHSDDLQDPTIRVARRPRNPAFARSFNDLLALATPEAVPSGILLTSPLTVFSMQRLDGAQLSAITQRDWEQHYDDLRAGIIERSTADGALPPLSEVKERAAAHVREGTQPIAIFDLDYHSPSKRLIAAVASAARRDRAIRLPGDPGSMIAGRRAFAASALVSDLYDNFVRRPPQHVGLDVPVRS